MRFPAGRPPAIFAPRRTRGHATSLRLTSSGATRSVTGWRFCDRVHGVRLDVRSRRSLDATSRHEDCEKPEAQRSCDAHVVGMGWPGSLATAMASATVPSMSHEFHPKPVVMA